jgi:hypothetical protein
LGPNEAGIRPRASRLPGRVAGAARQEIAVAGVAQARIETKMLEDPVRYLTKGAAA